MRDWQTYRNGNPRAIWDLERLLRHRAAKLGYRVHRSRRRKGRDNAGQFMLVHKGSSTVLLGAGFTATLESILEFIDRERMHSPMRSTRANPMVDWIRAEELYRRGEVSVREIARREGVTEGAVRKRAKAQGCEARWSRMPSAADVGADGGRDRRVPIENNAPEWARSRFATSSRARVMGC